MSDHLFAKTLIEALEDDGIRQPSILPELILPWAVALYGAAHPTLWRQMGAVMRRWRSEWGRRYIDVLLNVLVTVCVVGLMACIVVFVILIVTGG